MTNTNDKLEQLFRELRELLGEDTANAVLVEMKHASRSELLELKESIGALLIPIRQCVRPKEHMTTAIR